MFGGNTITRDIWDKDKEIRKRYELSACKLPRRSSDGNFLVRMKSCFPCFLLLGRNTLGYKLKEDKTVLHTKAKGDYGLEPNVK